MNPPYLFLPSRLNNSRKLGICKTLTPMVAGAFRVALGAALATVTMRTCRAAAEASGTGITVVVVLVRRTSSPPPPSCCPVLLRHHASSHHALRRDTLLGQADDLDDMFTPISSVMPALHKIQQQGGVTFANSFVTTPVCCPSRSSIMAGRCENHC